MDLGSLQQQLKRAIQCHQILVAKMKEDPQNCLLQKQLHELQAEIMALSDKQKQVVQQLRKEFEIKQHQAVNSTCTHVPRSNEVQTITLQASSIPLSKVENLIVVTKAFPMMTTTTSSVIVPIAQLPKSTEPATPPIRVPQYPPPHNRPSVVQSQSRPPSTPPPLTPTQQSSPIPQKEVIVISPKVKLNPTSDLLKVDFMASLGLITHDTLSELQNRRSERKRRTTANPQFSYGNWAHPDKKRKSNHYLTSSFPPNFKRPRGRPRLGSTPNNSRPTTPDDGSDRGSPNGVLRNGLLDHEDICAICQNTGDVLNCDTCLLSYHRDCLEPSPLEKNPGSWMCPKCQLMKKMPLQWPGSLAMVHSYIAHKAVFVAAKEEEKRKLVKRSLELKSEHNQLEQKAKQLGDAVSLQVQKRSDLLSHCKKTQDSIDKLKNLIKYFQVS